MATAQKSYVLNQDYKAPFVQMTGNPRQPQRIRAKMFKRGQIIKGELKHANGAPAFVLVGSTLPFPLSVVKEVVTKDIVSNAEGVVKETETKKITVKIPSSVSYVDGVVIGAALGFGAMYLAEKKNWIVSVDKKNKLYSAAVGALIGVYLIYKFKK